MVTGKSTWQITIAKRHRIKEPEKSAISAKVIRNLTEKILNSLSCKHIPPQVKEISIVICDDEYIRKLNKEFRGKDKPTDVLSFPLLSGDPETDSVVTSLGDIAISIETTRRQAAEYKHTPKMEVLRLLIHGILHLLGFDHEGVSAAEANRMRRLETKIFNSLSEFA